MLDEKALRKPEFDENASAPITLADSQIWYFRKPMIDLRPSLNGDGDGVASHGVDYEDDLKRIGEPMTTRQFAGLLFGLARSMLVPNYTLTLADSAEILRYAPDDPATLETWKTILGVARGSIVDVPKPTPATS